MTNLVHTFVLYPCTPLGISGNVECPKDGPITLTEYIVKRGDVSVQVSVCSETYHRYQGINLTIYINNHLSVFMIVFNIFNP